MRKASLRWAPEAKRNLKSIQQYIGRNAPRTAAAFVKRLVEAVEVLRDFPEIGATVPELEPFDYRELLYGNYSIIYSYQDRRVEIFAVQHGAMQMNPTLFID
jgi:addiction module RelE/StbE family toxin